MIKDKCSLLHFEKFISYRNFIPVFLVSSFFVCLCFNGFSQIKGEKVKGRKVLVRNETSSSYTLRIYNEDEIISNAVTTSEWQTFQFGPATLKFTGKKNNLMNSSLNHFYDQSAFLYDLSRMKNRIYWDQVFVTSNDIGKQLNEAFHHLEQWKDIWKNLDDYIDKKNSVDSQKAIEIKLLVESYINNHELTDSDKKCIEEGLKVFRVLITLNDVGDHLSNLKIIFQKYFNRQSEDVSMSKFVSIKRINKVFVEFGSSLGMSYKYKDWKKDSIPKIQKGNFSNVIPFDFRIYYKFNEGNRFAPTSYWISVGALQTQPRWFQTGPDSAIVSRKGFEALTCDFRGTVIFEIEKRKFRFLIPSIDLGFQLNAIKKYQLSTNNNQDVINKGDYYLHSWNVIFGTACGFAIHQFRARIGLTWGIQPQEYNKDLSEINLKSITTTYISLSVPILRKSQLTYIKY